MTPPVRPRLHATVLRVRDLDVSTAFYRDRLGMTVLEQAGGAARLGYGGDPGAASVELRPGGGDGVFGADRADAWWKIGVTVPDVTLARDRLVAAGVQVSDPVQFRDIGFLCHLRDPDGYVIELLQHTFHPRVPGLTPDAARPLGQPAALGQLTLRVTDIDASLRFYGEGIGLRLLSVQPVPEPGFTLWFLAATEETPPDTDLDAVGNREWLWQRPYTTLELQRWDLVAGPLNTGAEGDGGFWGLSVRCANPAALTDRLIQYGAAAAGKDVLDPDGIRIRLVTDGNGVM